MEATESGQLQGNVSLDEEDSPQEMKDEEDLDLYDEETFGIDSEAGADLSEDLSLLCEALGAGRPEGAEEAPRPDGGLEPANRDPPPPERMEGERAAGDPEVSGVPSVAQELSDPAVMEAVHGRPSLESLDSAIVDSGVCSGWEEFDITHVLDSALLKSVEEAALLETARSPLLRHFPGSPGTFRPSLGQRRGPLGHGPLGMPSRSVPPLRFRPLSPALPGGKVMPMRFGSPSPSACYTPPPNVLETFRFPEHVTEFHPQHRRILSQRQQRMGRESTQDPNVRGDTYAKLMTEKEKAWVIKLQMIQLQSENPHLDDYYYQEFFRKLEHKLADRELGKDAKREPQKLVTPYVQKAETYDSVVHIEGSLGQVAVSTCYSPRRAIDVVHVSLLEEDPPNLGGQRLRLLDNIEKMFGMLLEAEEAETHLVSVVEEERQTFWSLRDGKLDQLWQLLGVGGKGEDSEFFRILRVGKGIKLVSRVLPLLCSARCAEVLLSVAASLRRPGKEGLPETLPLLFPQLRVTIPSLSFSQLISLLRELTGGGEVPHLSLQHLFQNTFSISFLYALLSHGETLLSLACPVEPCPVDVRQWTDTIFLVARELSLTPKSSVAEPLHLPSNLLSLFCRYVDKQTAHTLGDKIESGVSDPHSRTDP